MLRPIGLIESCFREKFGTPRQGALVPRAPARLRIRPEFIPEQSLVGLSEFSHVWLIFHFNLNTNKAFLSKIHPPRLQGKTMGVFASRSPHRPCPIGLTLARLKAVARYLGAGPSAHTPEGDPALARYLAGKGPPEGEPPASGTENFLLRHRGQNFGNFH